MAYDPFVRGPFPVGVRSGVLIDPQRDQRRLPFEVWYPATPRYADLDLHPLTQDAFVLLPQAPPLRQAAVRDAAVAPGRFPLVLFSHSSYGHRRQSTFVCTHLASHGYVVAAADHTGNTFAEWVAQSATGTVRTEEERTAYLAQIIADRVPDLDLLFTTLRDGAAGAVAAPLDADRAGLLGWSFGGWAALVTPERSERFGAVVALAPAGSAQPRPGIIPATLTCVWRRPVATLVLAAEADRFTPLAGLTELYARLPAPKTMVILRHADHDHFGDHIAVPLCPPSQAHLFTRGLALAHFDASLKDDPAAQQILTADPAAAVRERGVAASTYDPSQE